MFIALYFIPTVYVGKSFEYLCASDILSNDITPIKNYFEEVWVGKIDKKTYVWAIPMELLR